jgi:hypothetical protein
MDWNWFILDEMKGCLFILFWEWCMYFKERNWDESETNGWLVIDITLGDKGALGAHYNPTKNEDYIMTWRKKNQLYD